MENIIRETKKLTAVVFFLGGVCLGQEAVPLKQAEQAARLKTLRRDFDIRDRQSQSAADSPEASPALLRRASERGLRLSATTGGAIKLTRPQPGVFPSPQRTGSVDPAGEFLRRNHDLFGLSVEAAQGLRPVRRYPVGPGELVVMEQRIAGIPVFHSQIKLAVSAAKEVDYAVANDLVPQVQQIPALSLTPEAGVVQAYRSVSAGVEPAWSAELERLQTDDDGKIVFRNPIAAGLTEITCELMLFPFPNSSLRLAYRVILESGPEAWHEILVDAGSGELLFRSNLYKDAQGNVFPRDPIATPQRLVPFPDAWVDFGSALTSGNNVDAYLDADGDNAPDSVSTGGLSGGRAFSPSQNFNFEGADGSTLRDPRGFQAASVTNLFYQVNLAHDFYYALGFTEAAGNFQRSNFGRGGQEGDAVRAEAQDGRSVDNASFAPTPDGMRPRLQTGLWTRGTTQTLTDDLDFAYDAQTTLHEYGHGVSNRLVGGGRNVSCLSGTQSGAMGEGWSDYFALSYFDTPLFGSYITQNRTSGVRRFSYELYPLKYQDLGAAGYEVHDDGEIWAATLWNIRKAVGRQVADLLVVNGLKLTPCRPSFIDARDAIIAADAQVNGGQNRSTLWAVFAQQGMGFSASGFDYGPNGGVVHTAAFDLPPDLRIGNAPPRVTSFPPSPPAFGSSYRYRVVAEDPDGGILRFELARGPVGMNVDPSSGQVEWTSAFYGESVRIVVSDGQGGVAIHCFTVAVETPLRSGQPIAFTMPEDSVGTALIQVPADTEVLQVRLRGGTGDTDLALFDPEFALYGFSFRSANTETLSVAAPKAGVWRILVMPFLVPGSLSLTAELIAPPLLALPAAPTGLSDVQSGDRFFRVQVPAGASALRINTLGGSGDVVLMVRRGKAPVCQSGPAVIAPCEHNGRSASGLTDESLAIPNPAAGDYYINVHGFTSYSGVTLSVSVPTPFVVSPTSLTFSAPVGGSPPAQTLRATFPAGTAPSWTANATTRSGGNWLRVSPISGFGDASLRVETILTGLQAGNYQGDITISSAGSVITVSVTLTITQSSGVPTISNVRVTSFGLVNSMAFNEFRFDFLDPDGDIVPTPVPANGAAIEVRSTRFLNGCWEYYYGGPLDRPGQTSGNISYTSSTFPYKSAISAPGGVLLLIRLRDAAGNRSNEVPVVVPTYYSLCDAAP